LLAVLFAPLAACQGSSATKPASRPEPTPSPRVEQPPPLDVEELTLLLAGRAPTDEERAVGSKLSANSPETIERFVDSLLKDDGFNKDVGPRLIVGPKMLGTSAFALATNWVLHSYKQDTATVFYLRWKQKCTVNQAVKVKAWWSPDSPVLICPSSYLPERFENARKGIPKACDAVGPVADGLTDCGCGPNLVRCLPDDAMWKKVTAALTSETKLTLAHLLAEDAPIQAMFTTNATARTRYAELIYRRWLVEDKKLDAIPGLDELQSWSVDQPRWAERPEVVPGQHAGILTDPSIAFGSNGLRALMRLLLDTMWCSGEDSSHVDPQVVLTLGKEVRGSDGAGPGSGWEKLAAREVCTNCHARLDYSARAWMGFPDPRVGTHFMSRKQLFSKQRDASGPIYVDNIDDKRGEMPLNPLGFAKAAMAQPEFGACMTKKVVNHMFADTGTEEDARAVQAQFDGSGRLRDMMRVAAIRFIQRRLVAAPHENRTAAAGSANVKTLVTSLCQDCHDFYEKREPDQKELQTMLEMVYLQRMPKKRELSTAERNALIRALNGQLGRPSSKFFEDEFRAFSVHRPELITSMFANSTKSVEPADKTKKPIKLREVENTIDPAELEYTPSIALSLAVAAVKACEKSEGADASATKLAECAQRVSSKRTPIRSTSADP
jgi:hypothetical protein